MDGVGISLDSDCISSDIYLIICNWLQMWILVERSRVSYN